MTTVFQLSMHYHHWRVALQNGTEWKRFGQYLKNTYNVFLELSNSADSHDLYYEEDAEKVFDVFLYLIQKDEEKISIKKTLLKEIAESQGV